MEKENILILGDLDNLNESGDYIDMKFFFELSLLFIFDEIIEGLIFLEKMDLFEKGELVIWKIIDESGMKFVI